MSDLYLKPTENGGEIQFDDRNDFVLIDGLFTSCYISMFSEPYWGNELNPINSRIVSRLNKLFENPITGNTRNLAIRYTQEALNWLIENEIADEIIVDCEIQNNYTLVIVAKIIEPNENVLEIAYSLNWKQNKIESEKRMING